MPHPPGLSSRRSGQYSLMTEKYEGQFPQPRTDGGAAFPGESLVTLQGTFLQPGMSLRDWFAGQALAGIMAQSHSGPEDWTHIGWGWGEDTLNGLNRHETHHAVTVAGFSYAIADAMLKAREDQK